MSFLTEAAATLEYNTTEYTQEYKNIGHDENVSVQVLSLPPLSQTPVHHQSNSKQMSIYFPKHTDPKVAPLSSVQIQVN